MTLSMYDTAIPVLKQMLGSLSSILRKAEAHAANQKIEPAVLIQSRLYPDMFPLARQVQIATDQAKGCAARLAGIEIPKFEDTETTFEELQARIAKTVAFVETFTAAQIDGSEERDIVYPTSSRGDLHFKGVDYLLGFALPNFYFHVVTAYDILRANGVEIGKRDFLAG